MKKNLVKKAVLPALVALLCSVVALTSVSYAWFTMGNDAKVEGMQMNVTGADGLQISATGNASDFKSTLTAADLTAAGYKISLSKANPVSTVNKVTNGNMTFYKGTMDNGVLAYAESATKDVDYICFDIYVKVNVANKLYLDPTSVVSAVAVDGKTKQTNLASRVAFVNLGSKSTAAEAQALAGGNTTAKIWEPNSTTRSTAFTNAGGSATGGKLGYTGIEGTTTIQDSDKLKPTLSTGNVTTFDFEGATAVELCELTEGYNKIRVYIWLEGQDVDCLNEVSGGSFAITLNFKQDDLSEQASS